MTSARQGLPVLPTCLAGLLALPLLASVGYAVAAGLDAQAWAALLADTQTWPALGLTLWTGLVATALSALLAAGLLSASFPGPAWARLVQRLGPLLAVPHAAFAIGLAFLLAPSGWLLRLLSPWATGFDAPPPWLTTQDPWGFGLIAVLVAKEVPFLLWAAATQLQRADVANTWTRELLVARSLGYSARTAWWRVLWPQLRPRLALPLLAVLAYGLAVVDVTLVIGPTSPPTLAVLAWQWLTDADLTRNAQGTAAAWLLTAVVAMAAGVAWWMPQLPAWRTRRTGGHRGQLSPVLGGYFSDLSVARMAVPALLGLYAAVILALAVGSVAGVWPFPAVWPNTFTWRAWASVGASASTVVTTLSLGLTSAITALLWCVAWLEWAPPRWQAALRPLLGLPLVLPSVLWVVGVHALALRWGLDATWVGVWLAHLLATVPYVLIALSPAYTGFDPRYRQVCSSLGKGRAVYLWRVKWPLLRAALASSLAVGLAVSVAQYLPTLFVGAGRYSTVTTEAVTLASGGQRSLTSAYAWLQWLLPVLGFALAAWVGKPRRFQR